MKKQSSQIKPISSISNEDAIEVAKIMNINHLSPELTKIRLIKQLLRDFTDSKTTSLMWLDVIEFLASKGYEFPKNR